jgi:hypothetical protein
MAKVGSWNAPRYLAAYYPFLLPTLLLRRSQERVARTRWWRWISVAGVFLTTGLMALSRQRPVLPAAPATAFLERHFPNSQLVKKICHAYLFTTSLWEPLDTNFLAKIPADEKVVGYARRFGGFDRQLWIPLGRRRVEYVKADDPPDRLPQLGVTYLIVDREFLAFSNLSVEDCLQRYNADLLASVRHDFGKEMPVLECHLLRLRAMPAPTSK